MSIGSEERLMVKAQTCEFFREAEHLAKEYDQLDATINSSETTDDIIEILPPLINAEIIKKQEFKCHRQRVDESH
jgi:prefoldin subunit 5